MEQGTALAGTKRQFTKALKVMPVTASVADPETGEPIEITVRLRMMTDGGYAAYQRMIAERSVFGEGVGYADIVATLAPLVVEVQGVGDFPGAEFGTMADRFTRYFGGDGSEAPGDLEEENRIVLVLWGKYAPACFRLFPAQLAQMFSLLGGGDGETRAQEGEDARAEVRADALRPS